LAKTKLLLNTKNNKIRCRKMIILRNLMTTQR
jgi:hypothetical protein